MQTIRFPMGSFPNNSPSFESKKRIKILELYGLFRISVKIVYQDDTSDSFGELTKFRGSLNLSEDKLIQVDYCAKYHLDYICLRTLKGRIIKAGEAGIDIQSFIFPAYASIIGFFCNYGRFIFQFGMIVQENYDLKKNVLEKNIDNPIENELEMKKKAEEEEKKKKEKSLEFKKIGNKHFLQKEYDKAIEQYTQAMVLLMKFLKKF